MPFRCGAAGEASRRAPYIWRLSAHKRVPTFDHSPCLNKHAAAHSLLALRQRRILSALFSSWTHRQRSQLPVARIIRHGWNLRPCMEAAWVEYEGSRAEFMHSRISNHSNFSLNMRQCNMVDVLQARQCDGRVCFGSISVVLSMRMHAQILRNQISFTLCIVT